MSLSSLTDWCMLISLFWKRESSVVHNTRADVWIHLLPGVNTKGFSDQARENQGHWLLYYGESNPHAAFRGEQKGNGLQGSVSNLQEFLKPLGLMELAPRVMKLRNVGSVKLQSSLLECECTCGGKSAKRRVRGPKRREGSVPPRRRAEDGEASSCHPGPLTLWRLLIGTVCRGLWREHFTLNL